MDTHTVLQSKGGTGKSFISWQLAEYFKNKGAAVFGYDTDPLNRTFSALDGLHVRVVDIVEGNTINKRKFDPFVQELMELPDEATVVVDNGASTFMPWCGYMAQNPVLPMLAQRGRVFLHTVITGGALKDTLEGLESLAAHFPTTPIVVWLNRYFGEIVNSAGQKFEDMPEYEACRNNIHAIVNIPNFDRETYGVDMETLLTRRQTYDEAMQDRENWNLMALQRLTVFRREMSAELDKIMIY